MYGTPGHADRLSPELVGRWNELIVEHHQQVIRDHPSLMLQDSMVTLDPTELTDPRPVVAKWFGDPLEAINCVGRLEARRLCDSGLTARQRLHNEYCEYRVVHALDRHGQARPKRVEVTTELREYWQLIATHSPIDLRVMASDVLGFEPTWHQLYGSDDPEMLSPERRAASFGRVVAGDGQQTPPAGPLNRDHLLFMTHPINGLDDLLFVVMLGAKPYVHRVGDKIEPASLDAIFSRHSLPQLFCRHADPAAVGAAHAAAMTGRTIAFADPLGVYIVGFNQGAFRWRGQPVPDEWVRRSRGPTDAFQRLVFGPDDDDDAFLNEIIDVTTATDQPVIGGFQVLQHLEVGPLVEVGAPKPLTDGDLIILEPLGDSIDCSNASHCEDIREVVAELGTATPTPRTPPAQVRESAVIGARPNDPTRTLQEGIYFDCTGCTGSFFNALFLRAAPTADASEIVRELSELWTLYQGLKHGLVPDLPGQPVPQGDLQVLIGYGKTFFDIDGVHNNAPDALVDFNFDIRNPPAGGQPVLDNSGLLYADDLDDNPARADIVLQFTAGTQLATHRCVVETWKHLQDRGADSLRVSGVFSGFQRDDGRSWIDFHDGVNNLRRGRERADAITIKPGAVSTLSTVGGTYLAYLRVVVDLNVWRSVPTTAQELLVGRSKLTGAPLVDIHNGTGVHSHGCPVSNTNSVLDAGNEAFRDPPPVEDPVLRSSHVQRANHHVPNPKDPSSGRIFRQGYEFLETLEAPPYYRVGLNFVSFQDTPQRLHRVLTTDGWLGGVNFGGQNDQSHTSPQVLSVRAAGIFVVPPIGVAGTLPRAD